jgi:hypothetical protein
MTKSNRRLLLGKTRILPAIPLAIVLPLQSAQNLTTGIALRPESGWVRYGTVASVSQNTIKLASPTAVGLHPNLPHGQIAATTRVWTSEALRGFEGSVIVFLLDENKRLIFQTKERHWGVNGEAIPGAPSDRKENWAEAVPVDVLAQTRYVTIFHSDHPTSHWEDTMGQIATFAGYVIIAIACAGIGNEFVYNGDGDWSCESPSDSQGSDVGSAAATGATRPAKLGASGRAEQFPLPGQMVWLNRSTNQALWTVFPISAHRKDDVGTSDYLETSVTVSYPPTTTSAARPLAVSPPAVGAKGAASRTPCCIVSGIDERSGIVTAHVNGAPERAFRFQPTNPAVLRTLKIGQGIYANFGTKQVSLDGTAPCACMWLEGPTNPR